MDLWGGADAAQRAARKLAPLFAQAQAFFPPFQAFLLSPTFGPEESEKEPPRADRADSSLLAPARYEYLWIIPRHREIVFQPL